MASEARAKAKMYAEVERKLGEKIEELDGKIDAAEKELDSDYNTFMTGGDAEGMLKTRYDGTLLIWRTKYQAIINKMQMGVMSLRYRKTSAVQLKEYWMMKAEIEEMKENAGF